MDDKEKIHLEHSEKILVDFLLPMPVAEKMSNGKDILDAMLQTEDMHQQTIIFIKALQDSTDNHIYDQFKNALLKCDEQQWLYTLIFDESDKDLGLYLTHAEHIKTIKNILHQIRQSSHHITTTELLACMSTHFSDDERERIKATDSTKGNIYGLWLLLFYLSKKAPEAIFDFCKFVKQSNLRASDGSGKLLFEILKSHFENLNEYMPVNEVQNTSIQFVEMEVDEPCSSVTKNLEEGNLALNNSCERVYIKKRSSSISADSDDVTAKKSRKLEEDQCSSNVLVGYPQTTNDKHNYTRELNLDNSILRSYQKELIDKACGQENSIVSASPGCGKTLIAAHLIKLSLDHYQHTPRQTQRKCKVIFLAPTVGLVNQQTTKLSTYFNGSSYSVGSTHGSSSNEDDAQFKLDTCDIVCATPQSMMNVLLEENKSTSFDDFNLFIFDECHHCMKLDPYVHLMMKYFQYKTTNPQCNPPKIIGLTATLGIGKTTNTTKAKQNILQLCANLDAVGGIKTVQSNIAELQQYVAIPEQRSGTPKDLIALVSRLDKHLKETITLPEKTDNRYSKKLKGIMDEINMVMKELKVIEQFAAPNLRDFASIEKGTLGFTQNCGVLTNLLNESTDFKYVRDSHACVDCLLECNKALEMQWKLPVISSTEYLKEYYFDKVHNCGKVENATEERVNKILNDGLRDLEDLSKAENCQNSNLKEMQEVILQTFNQQTDSRVMIMVDERYHTVALKKWVESNEDLKDLKAEIFVGVARVKNSKIFMSDKDQQRVLLGFDQGKHKLLICTSEAIGEGLDVKKCNLVVSYDYSKNEINMIQQSGRVRQKGGKLVNMSSPRIVEQHEKNIYKIKVMEEATREIQEEHNKDAEMYLSELKRLQKVTENEFKHHIEKMLKEVTGKTTAKEYILVCRKCRINRFSSLDVRRAFDTSTRKDPKYINISADFKDMYNYKSHPKPVFMGKDWIKTNKIMCNSCGNPWGIEACWKNSLPFPLLRMQGFRITDPLDNEFVQLPTKWQDACFVPEIANLHELNSLQNLCG